MLLSAKPPDPHLLLYSLWGQCGAPPQTSIGSRSVPFMVRPLPSLQILDPLLSPLYAMVSSLNIARVII